jgi:hypothetical protein
MKLLTNILGAAALLGAVVPSAIAQDAPCNNPATTGPNARYTIELDGGAPSVVGDLYKYTYIITKTFPEIGGNQNPDASHLTIQMTQVTCLGIGKTLSDLVVGGRFKAGDGGWTDLTVQLGLDPTTGIVGMKIDVPGNVLEGASPYYFEFTLDGTALAPGFTLGVACIPAAVKAGNQANETANVLGPKCLDGTEPPATTITLFKYYDKNVDGAYDLEVDCGISGWEMKVTVLDKDGVELIDNESVFMNANGLAEINLSTVEASLFPLSYTVTEVMPSAAWMALEGVGGYTGTIETPGSTLSLRFGNVRLGNGNAGTIGFWGNKNGQDLITADDLAALRALELVRADGSDFDPHTKPQLRDFLRNASATNMAYMLSAQLAATTLNVRHDRIGGDMVYAPLSPFANTEGFVSISAVMVLANAALCANNVVLTGHPQRASMEALKNFLDGVNNNLYPVLQEGPDCD